MPKEAKEMMNKQQMMSQIMQVVYSTDLQEELSMVPDQIAELKKISEAYQKEMMQKGTKTIEMSKQVQALVAEGKNEEAAELGKELRETYMASVNKITEQANDALLPHQVERLNQISKQQSMKTFNKFGDEFGIPYAMASELELSKDQKRTLEKTTARVRKKYYEELEALKSKAKQEIIDELSKEQQTKLTELLGDFYDQETSRRASRRKMLDRARSKSENN